MLYYQLGYFAQKSGKSISSNPFLETYFAWFEWNAGFSASQAGF